VNISIEVKLPVLTGRACEAHAGHVERPGPCGLLRNPARQVFGRMGNRALGGARLPKGLL